MAEAKEQLEQTREKVREAAEKLKDEKLADAANSATRAQRELEKMQEDFRQKTSKKFADEVKQIRQQARDAAENQKKISEALENQKEAGSEIEKSMQNAAQSRQVSEQQENIQKLLTNLTGIDNRRACFRTVITLILNGEVSQFEGAVYGTITHEPVGDLGFGYDPVFTPDGYDRTFAQMTLEEKNVTSHRAIAVRKMADYLEHRFGL
jgi:non-canonical purine NTP pyrophosphatase (RdgB/HAM1 family)